MTADRLASHAAILAAGGGCLALVGAGKKLFAPDWPGPDVPRVVGLVVAGCVLLGYAAAQLALRRRPGSWLAVAARAAFTAAGTAGAAFVVWRLLNQPAPPQPADRRGMYWLASLAGLVWLTLAAGFTAAEVAAWTAWWRQRRGRPGPA